MVDFYKKLLIELNIYRSDESRLSFLKRRSLREKLRDKTWSLRRSSEKELSPSPGSGSSPAGSHGDASESRLSRLFSLRYTKISSEFLGQGISYSWRVRIKLTFFKVKLAFALIY